MISNLSTIENQCFDGAFFVLSLGQSDFLPQLFGVFRRITSNAIALSCSSCSEGSTRTPIASDLRSDKKLHLKNLPGSQYFGY